MNKNSEQPAYPIFNEYGHAEMDDKGLTKREYFAAMAMQGILASNNRMSVAENAIKFADALLKQLETK